MTLFASARLALNREPWSCMASTSLRRWHEPLAHAMIMAYTTSCTSCTSQKQRHDKGGRPLFSTSIMSIFAAGQIRTRNKLTRSKTSANTSQACYKPPRCSGVCSRTCGALPGSRSGAHGHPSSPPHPHPNIPQPDRCCQHVQLGEQRPADDRNAATA